MEVSQKLTFLIVDDMPPHLADMRNMIANYFPQASIDTATSKTGAERILGSKDISFAIIDLDIDGGEGQTHVEGMWGLGLITETKKKLPHVRLIAYTRHETIEIRRLLASINVPIIKKFTGSSVPLIALKDCILESLQPKNTNP